MVPSHLRLPSRSTLSRHARAGPPGRTDAWDLARPQGEPRVALEPWPGLASRGLHPRDVGPHSVACVAELEKEQREAQRCAELRTSPPAAGTRLSQVTLL